MLKDTNKARYLKTNGIHAEKQCFDAPNVPFAEGANGT
jgi:hypothetical protein